MNVSCYAFHRPGADGELAASGGRSGSDSGKERAEQREEKRG